MSLPDILRIYKEGGRDVDARINVLRRYVVDHDVKITKVVNQADYDAIRSSEFLSRFPEEERRFFTAQSTFTLFLSQYGLIKVKSMPIYFLHNIVDINVNDVKQDRIGVVIQSSSDVVVATAAKPASLHPYELELVHYLREIRERRSALQTLLDDTRATVTTQVDAAITAFQKLAVTTSESVTSLTLFDQYLGSQLDFDINLNDHPGREKARLLIDRLYEIYLTREYALLRMNTFLASRPSPSTGEAFNYERLSSPLYKMTFHDYVGRRFLLLSTAEDFDRENRNYNENVRSRILADVQLDSDVIRRRFPADLLVKAYGYTMKEHQQQYNDLLQAVRVYFKRHFNVDSIVWFNTNYIKYLSDSHVLPLLVQTADYTNLGSNVHELLQVIDESVNRKDLARAYRTCMFDSDVGRYRRAFHEIMIAVYPTMNVDQDSRERVPSADELLQGFVAALHNIMRIYFLRMQVADNYMKFNVKAQRLILMCRAQATGFLRLLIETPRTLLEFFRAGDGRMNDMCASIPGYSSFVDSRSATTTYQPLMFVRTNETPTDALLSIYRYHLANIVADLKKLQNKASWLNEQRERTESSTFDEILRLETIIHESTQSEREDITSFREVNDAFAINEKKYLAFSRLLDDLPETDALQLIRHLPASGSIAALVLQDSTTSYDVATDDLRFRFYTMFELLMSQNPTHSPSTVLLYLFLRHTQHLRGIDSQHQQRAFETWVTMQEHMNSIVKGGEDDIGYRISNRPDYARETTVRVNTPSSSSSDTLNFPLNERPLHEYDGRFWCRQDIYSTVQDARAEDYIRNVLTLGGTNTTMIDLQLRALADLDDSMRSALLSVMAPTCSYVDLDNVSWQSVKYQLWRLHPSSVAENMLTVLNAPPSIDYKDADYKVMVESLAFLHEDTAFNSDNWTRDVEYFNNDQYINAVHVNQITKFSAVVEKFEASPTKNLVYSTLNDYAERVSSEFFDIWMDTIPSGFFSSHITIYLDRLSRVYAIDFAKVLPLIEDDALPDIFTSPSNIEYVIRALAQNSRVKEVHHREISFYLIFLVKSSLVANITNRDYAIQVLESSTTATTIERPPKEERKILDQLVTVVRYLGDTPYTEEYRSVLLELLRSPSKIEEFVDALKTRIRRVHAILRSMIFDDPTTASRQQNYTDTIAFDDLYTRYLIGMKNVVVDYNAVVGGQTVDSSQRKQAIADYVMRFFVIVAANSYTTSAGQALDTFCNRLAAMDVQTVTDDVRDKLMTEFQDSLADIYPVIVYTLASGVQVKFAVASLRRMTFALQYATRAYNLIAGAILRYVDVLSEEKFMWHRYSTYTEAFMYARQFKFATLYVASASSLDFTAEHLKKIVRVLGVDVLTSVCRDCIFEIDKSTLDVQFSLIRARFLFRSYDKDYQQYVASTTTEITPQLQQLIDRTLGETDTLSTKITDRIVLSFEDVMSSTEYTENDRVLFSVFIQRYIDVLSTRSYAETFYRGLSPNTEASGLYDYTRDFVGWTITTMKDFVATKLLNTSQSVTLNDVHSRRRTLLKHGVVSLTFSKVLEWRQR